MQRAVHLTAPDDERVAGPDRAHLPGLLRRRNLFSKRRAEHVNDLRAVLDRIRDAGHKLKPAKCKLFCEQELYFGHVISAAGVSPDPAKLRVLAEWPLPTTVREMQSFLGFVNFYSDFIDEQTALTSSLYNLTAARKGTELVNFRPEDVERFAELKRRLCAAPRLAHPNLELPFTLYTDASKIAVGAVLLQLDTAGIERPISFFSKKLSPAQRNYSTFERECLAIICALEHFRVYLFARPLRLRTDHRALQWLFSKEPKASARISGWLATLMEYFMQIEYVRGSENAIADALSRLDSVSIDSEVPAELARGVPSYACPVAEADRLDARIDWVAQQSGDATIARVIHLLNNNARVDADELEANPALKPYADAWQQLTIEDGLLKHFNRFNIAPQPDSLFYFRIARQYGLDQPKLEAVNRLIQIVLYMSLAPLVMLVNAGLIPVGKQEDWRREHSRRHLSSETSEHVYELVVDAPSKKKKRTFYKTVNAFLSTDDNTLRVRARSAKWPAID